MAESSLSSHALHMRRAVDDLRSGIDKISGKLAADINIESCTQDVHHSAYSASQRYQQERDDGLDDIHDKIDCCTDCFPIDTIQVHKDGSWSEVHRANYKSCNEHSRESNDNRQTYDAYKFKQQYINRNIPCIIRGLDQSHFKDISIQWRTQEKNDDSNNSSNTINTEWFSKYVGNDTLVPVRIDNIDGSTGLDEDGRAEECQTKHMKLSEWISQCQEPSSCAGYLKDWHLVQFLSNNSTERPRPTLPLYTLPTFFERDVLNNFLQRYSDGGDYKFCYWGPKGSKTCLHSDVLHSFSWSYNVVGQKKWVFHVPSSYNNINSNDCAIQTFEVIQQTGEAIFVPSIWKHEVTNLVETISINHNWITSANLDKTWQCLICEIQAIETEVKAWEMPDDDFEARENMLRGCIGLDVTMFILMIMIEIIYLLQMFVDSVDEDQDRLWDCVYSLFRIEEVLVQVIRLPNLDKRLEAMLNSERYASEVIKIANDMLAYISKLKDDST